MERRIDFSRARRMLCGACGHGWRVDLDWLDRWEQAKEKCEERTLAGLQPNGFAQITPFASSHVPIWAAELWASSPRIPRPL
jgi:hypothetical protein